MSSVETAVPFLPPPFAHEQNFFVLVFCARFRLHTHVFSQRLRKTGIDQHSLIIIPAGGVNLHQRAAGHFLIGVQQQYFPCISLRGCEILSLHTLFHSRPKTVHKQFFIYVLHTAHPFFKSGTIFQMKFIQETAALHLQQIFFSVVHEKYIRIPGNLHRRVQLNILLSHGDQHPVPQQGAQLIQTVPQIAPCPLLTLFFPEQGCQLVPGTALIKKKV